MSVETLQLPFTPVPRGETFDPEKDLERLGAQMQRVFIVLNGARKRGEWTTLSQIAWATGAPEASVSARLRDVDRLPGWRHERRRVEGKRGLWEYRIVRSD